MENKLLEILLSLNLDIAYEVGKQGFTESLEVLPENYFTYWCWDNARGGYYDNKHTKNNVGFQIVAYSTRNKTAILMIEKAVEELEKNGFLIDEDPTDHHTSENGYKAQIVDVYFEKKKEE